VNLISFWDGENMSENSKMVLLTGLWKSKTKDQATMLSGNLTRSSRFVILPNKAKQAGKAGDEKKPDFLIFLAANDPDPKSSNRDPGI
jgi:hypothetical protein